MTVPASELLLKEFLKSLNQLISRLADFLKQRRLKASIGIICDSLEDDKPDYFRWIKELQATGLVEFWFHGYDHKTHNEGGAEFNEFNNRSLQDQKARFSRSEQLASQKLGLRLQTFGPTGGTGNGLFDKNTVRAMADDRQMRIWLYPRPLDADGKALEQQGRVIILDRVWQVNIEKPTFHPNLNALEQGYNQFAASRAYFVIQGHPGAWDDARFAEFVQIVDFLRSKGCTFMAPTEYCRAHDASKKNI